VHSRSVDSLRLHRRSYSVLEMVDGKGTRTPRQATRARKPWTLREYSGKTVWDWLHLSSALAVPIVLAFVGLWFTAQQNARLQHIEEQRTQDEALQAYLD
jgi:hypothetical protein